MEKKMSPSRLLKNVVRITHSSKRDVCVCIKQFAFNVIIYYIITMSLYPMCSFIALYSTA